MQQAAAGNNGRILRAAADRIRASRRDTPLGAAAVQHRWDFCA
jgi:hypothetical protein